MTTNEKALLLHEKWCGKLDIQSKAPIHSREDLALAYTPGVAEPCKVIAENKEAAYNYLNQKDIFGIKLQLLHVLEGTDLADDYRGGIFKTYEKDEYLDILIHCLELLSPEIVVHRVTGDGPKDILIAPRWSLNKRDVLNTLHSKMKLHNNYQGRVLNASRSIDTI